MRRAPNLASVLSRLILFKARGENFDGEAAPNPNSVPHAARTFIGDDTILLDFLYPRVYKGFAWFVGAFENQARRAGFRIQVEVGNQGAKTEELGWQSSATRW